MQTAILINDQPSLFELGCATELFCIQRPEFKQWYNSEIVSFGYQKMQAVGGLSLRVKTIRSLDAYEFLVIPGWTTDPSTLSQKLKHTLEKQLREFTAQGKRVISFCSGAFLLAQTGLLNGKKATTHWRYSDLLKKSYPEVNLVENVLYTFENNIACSAGSSAAIDLGLEIIRQDFGYTIANKVARRLVMAPHRNGGQSQFVETPMLAEQNNFTDTIDWAMQKLDKSITIEHLAEHARMSRRSFDRHFRKSYDMSPTQWLIRQRLTLAQNFLESSQQTIERVAQLSGFANAVSMRHHFRQQLGISPVQYRQQFLQQ